RRRRLGADARAPSQARGLRSAGRVRSPARGGDRGAGRGAGARAVRSVVVSAGGLRRVPVDVAPVRRRAGGAHGRGARPGGARPRAALSSGPEDLPPPRSRGAERVTGPTARDAARWRELEELAPSYRLPALLQALGRLGVDRISFESRDPDEASASQLGARVRLGPEGSLVRAVRIDPGPPPRAVVYLAMGLFSAG